MTGPMFLLLAVPLVAVLGYLVWKREQARRAKWQGFALSNRWRYFAHDPYGLVDRWHDDPFGRGHSRVVRHVVEGTRSGRPFVSFDYKYEETTTDSDGDSHTTTYHFHVTALQLPASLTELTVTTENVLSRLGNALGLDDIELESEDFNRRYRVRCASPKFAHDVLHPRTMHALLHGDALPFRITGNTLMTWQRGRAEPTRLVAHLARLLQVVDGVPTFVWKDHGYDPAATPNPGVTT